MCLREFLGDIDPENGWALAHCCPLPMGTIVDLQRGQSASSKKNWEVNILWAVEVPELFQSYSQEILPEVFYSYSKN